MDQDVQEDATDVRPDVLADAPKCATRHVRERVDRDALATVAQHVHWVVLVAALLIANPLVIRHVLELALAAATATVRLVLDVRTVALLDVLAVVAKIVHLVAALLVVEDVEPDVPDVALDVVRHVVLTVLHFVTHPVLQTVHHLVKDVEDVLHLAVLIVPRPVETLALQHVLDNLLLLSLLNIYCFICYMINIL